ncbi:hypothetical protein [Halomicrobium katesii]|uniref:hypothetical protein n=1 Tax=Halomicrobium katesii TaxID=437163 RepID=UPI0003811863|nr:hypothetical protein [Halomicrobium katesii]
MSVYPVATLTGKQLQLSVSDTAHGDEHSEASVEATLDDALERVAHGATVSIPGILFQRALTLAFIAVLTNGFSAGAYGVFAVVLRWLGFTPTERRLAETLLDRYRTRLSRR